MVTLKVPVSGCAYAVFAKQYASMKMADESSVRAHWKGFIVGPYSGGVRISRVDRPAKSLHTPCMKHVHMPVAQSISSVADRLRSRRSFLKSSAMLIGAAQLPGARGFAQSDSADKPLFAYIGTYSSPLRDMPATQVDLPPGNGRGIHYFRVNRSTGALTPAGVYELGTSPSCVVINAAGTHIYSAN